TTTVNGVEVDSRTLAGDQIRRHGSFGFAGGTSATVRSVKVTGTGARDFSADLTTGANPFENGIATPAGLTFRPRTFTSRPRTACCRSPPRHRYCAARSLCPEAAGSPGPACT
ncbi:hypothetical protein PV518_44195, partial [Streptomyces sp. ND04-05B]|uniref:hypothetical protein n=1 Tax=Streptomyces sp. ND04-05B TaxID=3028693 RepID=UPI0029BF8D39